MTKKVNIFLGFITVSILLAISASYYKYIILQDYVVVMRVDCNPEYESCFIVECDSESEECPDDATRVIEYYKILYRNAHNVSLCEIGENQCSAFICNEGEIGCGEVFCSSETLIEYGIVGGCADSVSVGLSVIDGGLRLQD